MCGAMLGNLCSTKSISEQKSKENRTMQKCEPLTVDILQQLHGPAFDARYMSITEPLDGDDDSLEFSLDRKRNADSNRPSFYMTSEYGEVLSEEPAWNIKWDVFQSKITKQTRRKRRSALPNDEESTELPEQESDTVDRDKRHNQSNNKLRSDPWKCERKVKWMHLGSDYYPSHLRTVECTKPKCYYNLYKCMPRSFAVRILQRRRGVCADAASLEVYGFTGKSAEYWEWIDYPVNFCCDCVSNQSNKYY